jgi:hypothetical protein
MHSIYLSGLFQSVQKIPTKKETLVVLTILMSYNCKETPLLSIYLLGAVLKYSRGFYKKKEKNVSSIN